MKKMMYLLCVLLACTSVLADFGVMIDAGSSGSRIYLYEWKPRNSTLTLPLVGTSKCINQLVVSMKTNDALSSYATDKTKDINKAGQSLAPLIQYIKEGLMRDDDDFSDIPIYLYATAGMRAVTNLTAQEQIMVNVRAYLRTSGFSFHNDQDARVIRGDEEGYYGWITANYLKHVLSLSNPSVTYGALDMGGASTQIAFQPKQHPSSYNVTKTLANNTYDLYDYSYPLGQDQVRRLLLSGFSADSTQETTIDVPCFLKGYTYDKKDWTDPNGRTATGTGNYAACREAVLQYIIQPNNTCETCGMQSVYQPSVEGIQFLAFSAFAYTTQFFKLPKNTSIAEIIAAGKSFCEMDYNTVVAANPGNSYVYQFCYASVYLSEVLLQYGFDVNSTDQISFDDKIQFSNNENIEITWALGAMINEADKMEAQHRHQSLSEDQSQEESDDKPESKFSFGNFFAGILAGLVISSMIAVVAIFVNKRNKPAFYRKVELESSTEDFSSKNV